MYQIYAEIDTSYKDNDGNTIWNSIEIHSALQTLKTLVKEYCNKEIVPILFEYELLKNQLVKTIKSRKRGSNALSAPTFKNKHEFAYAILENENASDILCRVSTGFLRLHLDTDPQWISLLSFARNWKGMRTKLNNHEIAQEEYEDWKRAPVTTGRGQRLTAAKVRI